MVLNREQIIKALECWASGNPCEGSCCPLFEISPDTCDRWIGRTALALIKELTEDVERVRKQCGEIIVECDERDAEMLKEVADWKAIAEQYQKQFEDCYEEKEQLGAVKEHLDLVVEGKLKCTSALEKQVLKLTEENERLRTENDYWKQQAFNGCMERGRMAAEIKRLTNEKGDI